MKVKRWSKKVRDKALALHKEGIGARRLAKLLKVPVGTILYWFDPKANHRRSVEWRKRNPGKWQEWKKKYDRADYLKHRKQYLKERKKYRAQKKLERQKELDKLRKRHAKELAAFKKKFGTI